MARLTVTIEYDEDDWTAGEAGRTASLLGNYADAIIGLDANLFLSGVHAVIADSGDIVDLIVTVEDTGDYG